MFFNINQESKFNINDNVYCIDYVPQYNDLYRNEMI